jgi:hypothetical protein
MVRWELSHTHKEVSKASKAVQKGIRRTQKNPNPQIRQILSIAFGLPSNPHNPHKMTPSKK